MMSNDFFLFSDTLTTVVQLFLQVTPPATKDNWVAGRGHLILVKELVIVFWLYITTMVHNVIAWQQKKCTKFLLHRPQAQFSFIPCLNNCCTFESRFFSEKCSAQFKFYQYVTIIIHLLNTFYAYMDPTSAYQNKHDIPVLIWQNLA